MKMKDIIIVIVAVLLIGICGYFIYNTLKPQEAVNSQVNQSEQEIKSLSDEEYESTLKQISEKVDYGGASLVDIGRNNPFGLLN